jgi:putative transposase
VVHALMQAAGDEVVGPKGKHAPDRTAKRHGHDNGSLTLGGRRVQARRPRMRTADDKHELPVATYEYFADRDPLTRAVMDRMLAGVSTRNFAQVGEPVGTDVEATASATSKTTVSEMFIERTRTALGELMSRRLDDVRLAVMMLDGLDITVQHSMPVPASGQPRGSLLHSQRQDCSHARGNSGHRGLWGWGSSGGL